VIWSPLLDNDILGCAAFAVTLAIYTLIGDGRIVVRELVSLHNAIWVGFIMYAIPIYILSSLADISILFDIDLVSLSYAARLSFISISVTGVIVEIMRPWAVSLQQDAIRQIASVTGDRQFYMAILLTIIYGLNYINSGVLNLISTGNRFEIMLVFETGKMWIIQYLMTGVTIAFIYQHFQMPTVRLLSFYTGLVSILLFWALYISLGNRRGVLSVVIAAVVCYVARNINGKLAIATLLMVFALAGLVGVLRQDTSSVVLDQALFIGLSNFFGEFIYPGFTLVHTVELGRPVTFEFTWISMFYDFVVAQLQGQKFEFLAHRFAVEAAPSGAEIMGFAYLPITEAFQNFGAVGAAVSGAVLLASVLFLASLYRNVAWIYLILFSLTLDINRSEFVAMVFQFVLITIGFLLTTKLRFN
jgi:hypothetical protein